MSAKPKAVQNIVLYGLFALFAGWIYSLTAGFPRPLLPGYPGSAMFPRLAVALMALFSLLGLVREVIGLRRAQASAAAPAANDEGDAGDPTRLVDVVAVFAILAGFVAVTEYLGMEVGVFAFTALMIYLVTRKPVAALLAGVVSVAVVYLLFVQALSVFMPLTFLPRYINW